MDKNSIRDAHTPEPGEIVFNTIRYRSSETVHRLGYFQIVIGPVLKIKTGFRGFLKVYRDMIKSFTRAYMSYIINSKYGFVRYFEVCKLHLP